MPVRAPAAADETDRGYRAPRWLPGAHLQTIWPALALRAPQVAYRRERWSSPDGDFVDLDWCDGGNDRGPLVVLFHGLEGSSASPYCRALATGARARGWRVVVVNWRGCSGEPNRMPRAYHSGDSDEVDWILRRLRPDYAVGVSLGGNALLTWLGRQGLDAPPIRAAAAISAPQDLQAGAQALARGFNRVYAEHFLRTLRSKSLQMLARHPGLFPAQRVAAARTFFEFDDCVTAPLHGFAGAIDYWTRSSSRQYLGAIALPTLVLNALNDPFLPPEALATRREASRHVTLDYPRTGGHVGFAGGRFPGRIDWMTTRVLDFLANGGSPHG